MILEGKELEGKIGEYGAYSVDINEKLVLQADIRLTVDVLKEIEKAVQKSNSDTLKKIFGAISGFFGVKAEAQIAAPAVDPTPVKTDAPKA
jgi:hypothetical protein